MRVLLLTSDAPAPRHVNGGTTRQYKIFGRLLELGHEVTVVGVFPPSDDPYVETLREQGFQVIALERPKSRAREVISAILRRPLILIGLATKTVNEIICSVYWVDLRDMARKALAASEFDALVVIHAYAAWWINDLETAVPSVIEVQELESPQHFANAERASGLSGWIRGVAARRSQRSERRMLPLYDQVVTMSNDEADALKTIVGPKLPPVEAIGNGADTSALAEIGPDPGDKIVLFTGTMTFPPNVNAAAWLAAEVWPKVLAQEPDARLKIVGRTPPPSVLALDGRNRTEVTADVPDMKPYLAEADICLLPMHEGGGTRLKLAEAMAAGRAIVSTTNGATGVDVTNGEELLIADEAKEFADAIVKLLGDREVRAQLGARGRAKSIAQYDWRSLGDDYEAMLKRVAGDS
jgi:glycosyltransferase involved in cell wall biosynthesis